MTEDSGRSPLESLAYLLEHGEAEERFSALESLAKIEGLEPLMLLLKAFGNSLWGIRRRASQIMAEKGQKALPLLETHLDDDDDDLSYWSIRTLAGFGEAAVKPLKSLLQNEDHDKRLFAVIALGETQHAAAVDPLIEALGDPMWSVRKAASEALVGIGKATVPSLRAAMKNPDLNIKYWSVKSLGRIMGQEAVPALAKTLASGKQEMRYYGVVALGETGSEEAVPHLIGALEDESWIVRQHAAKVLQEIGEPCVPHLIKGFESGGPDLKYWVIRLVGRIMGKRAVGVLNRFLKTDDDDLRYYAVTALGETGDTAAIPLLIEAFGERSWVVRKQASDILSRYGSDAVPALRAAVDHENEDIMFWAIRTLGEVGEAGIELLDSKFKGSSKRIRLFVLDALGKTNSSQAIRPLVKALGDEYWPVRKKAADILKNIGERCVPQLMRAASSENNDQRYWSKVVLSHFGVAASDVFLQVLREGSEEDRLNLLEGFQEFTDPAMAEMLLSEMEEQEDDEIKRLVVRFLAKARGDAVDVLLQELHKGNQAINDLLAWPLGQIAVHEASRLLAVLPREKAGIVEILLPVLAPIDTEAVFNVICRLADSGEGKVRKAALRALGKRNEDKVDELLIEHLENAVPAEMKLLIEILDSRPSREDIACLVKELGIQHEAVTSWVNRVLQRAELIEDRDLWKQVEKQREEVDRQLGSMAKADAERYLMETDLEELKNVPYHNLIKVIGNVLKLKYGLIQNIITQTDEESIILAAREYLLRKEKLGPVDVHKWVQAHARSHHYLVVLRQKGQN